MFNASLSPYLICYHSTKLIIDEYKFNVKLIAKTTTYMHGSNEQHSAYIYQRNIGGGALALSNVDRAICDPLFCDSHDLIMSGNEEQISNVISMQYNEFINSARVTRSKNVVHSMGTPTR